MKFLSIKTWLFLVTTLAIFASCEKEDNAFPVDRQANAVETYEVFQDVLIESLQDPAVRAFIKTEALKTVTYDYEVVYGMVKDETLSTGQTLAAAFRAAEQRLLDNGTIATPVVDNLTTVAPLLSINVPTGIFSWDTDIYVPPVILKPEDQKSLGYVVAEEYGGATQRLTTDAVPTTPLITLTENERMMYTQGQYLLDESLIMFVAPKQPGTSNKVFDDECLFIYGELICDFPLGPGPGTGPGPGPGPGPGSGCEPNYGHSVILTQLRVNNLGSYEFLGRPELRMNVTGGNGPYLAAQGTGQNIMQSLYKPRRRDVRNSWWTTNDYLFTWVSTYGEYITFRWDEEDGGVFSEETDNIEVTFQGEEYSVTTPVFLKPNSEHMGTFPVYICTASSQFGSSGGIQFRLNF